MPELNPKQSQFCEEYLIDLNATQAAIRAGYSPKTAGIKGFQLLKIVKIQERVAELKAKRQNRVEVTQDEVLQGIKDNVEMAKEDKQCGAINKSYELLGKHIDMFVDRTAIQNADGSNITFIEPPRPKEPNASD